MVNRDATIVFICLAVVVGVAFFASQYLTTAIVGAFCLLFGYFFFKSKLEEKPELPYMILREPLDKEVFAFDALRYNGAYRCYLLNAARDFPQKMRGERLKLIYLEPQRNRQDMDISSVYLSNSLTIAEGMEYLINEFETAEVKLVETDFDHRACEIRLKPPKQVSYGEIMERAVEGGDENTVAALNQRGGRR
jgi:hypothetical protein